MKKIICILIIITMLMPHVTVQAAPAASLLIPIAGAIAMMSYMGVDTLVNGVNSDVVQQQLGQMLLEYAAYKGTTIADLFPEGALTFSLGRLVCSTLGWNNLLDFAQWLLTGDDEGPLVDKVLYARENLSYNGIGLRRTFENPVEGYSIRDGQSYAIYPVGVTANVNANTAAEVFNDRNGPRIVYGYWWIGTRVVSGVTHVYGFSIQDTYAANSMYIAATPYFNQSLISYGNTPITRSSGQNRSTITINDKTWYVNYILLDAAYNISSSDILGSDTDVLGGLTVDEETISVEGELQYPTKVEDGETVPDIQEGAVVGIPDLPLDQSGEEAASTVIDLVTDAPLDTTKYGDGSGGDDDGDQEPIPIPPVIDVGVTGLEEVFPFSIPFDIYYIVTAFVGEPLAPNITLPLHVAGVGDYELHIDLSPYENVAIVLRSCELLLVILGLIILTNRVVR